MRGETQAQQVTTLGITLVGEQLIVLESGQDIADSRSQRRSQSVLASSSILRKSPIPVLTFQNLWEVFQVLHSVFKLFKPYGSDYGTILQAHFRNQV